MTRRRLMALLTAVAGLAFTSSAHAQNGVKAGSITKSDGTVSATLSWKAGEFAARAPRLQVSRAGTVVSDISVADTCKNCVFLEDYTPEDGPVQSILHVVDLDGDGEAEVSFDTYSAGAHCCTTQRIYGYDAAKNVYRRKLSVAWGNVGYTIEDLDGDGRPELSGADDAFAYAFASYAASAFPPHVLSYRVDAATGKAKAVDVTRRFPALIRKDAAYLLAFIRKAKPARDHEIQGAIAAYVADQYLLGKGSVGKAELARARKRKLTRAGFQTDLLKFLKAAGYR